MIVGVLKEGTVESRVALVPASIQALSKSGLKVRVEADAGEKAGYSDAEYKEKGAEIVSREEALKSDILVQVNSHSSDKSFELGNYRKGQIVIGMADPLGSTNEIAAMAKTGITAFGLELIPRISRAQSMDVLSSMATLAGYKAVLVAANHLPKMFPMMMTAAGTLKPAKVFIMGAGVAGLQAIGTAKRLGAVVHAFDVRPAVKEQVESLGGKFVEVELNSESAEDAGGYAKEQSEEFLLKQRELLAKVVEESDVVITTAAIPGRKSPILVTEAMVKTMAKGSVIVDLAAERGGNCELTELGKEVSAHGVSIFGPVNIPGSLPFHASQMLSKNIITFLKHLISKEGELLINLEDEITRGTLMCQNGEVIHPRLREILALPQMAPTADIENSQGEKS